MAPSLPNRISQAPSKNPGWHLTIVAVVYPLLDWISYIYPMAQFDITPWNPQPALAIALLMIHGQRWLPAVMAIVIVTEYLIRDTSSHWLSGALASLVLCLCFGAIAALLTQRYRISPRLNSSRDVLRLTVVVTLGTLGTGTLYVAALLAGGTGDIQQFPEALLRFWIGDSVGILVFLPLVLMLSDKARREQLRRLVLHRQAIAQGGLIAVILLFVFGQEIDEQVKYFYLTFLPLVWISARAGLIGSAVAALLIQTGVIAGVHLAGQPSLTVFQFQTFLIALTIMGLFLGVTVDERSQAEDALRESQKLAAAGQMAAALTHELSQPLTAVVNYARAGQLLVVAGNTDRRQLEDTMQKLVLESRRTADIVRRLRDFLQHRSMTMESIDLSALVQVIATGMQTALETAATKLRIVPPTCSTVVTVDALQIEIVLRNLLRNALDAVQTSNHLPRMIEIMMEQADGDLQVSVSDSGKGVKPDESEHIFEPFETSKASGMGMGLAVSRAIVEAHEGRLWAEPGPHGVFRFTLPMTGEESHD